MHVYLLPGIAGSLLDRNGGFRVWFNYSDIALGRVGLLELADNGVSAGGEGVPCFPIQVPLDHTDALWTHDYGFIDYYYRGCAKWLIEKGKEHGWSFIPWPYDWRLRTEITGQKLAEQLKWRWSTGGDRAILVAHSMGGLVARQAWRYLQKQNLGHIIQRIVCLGTPHTGSYYMLRSVFVMEGTDAATIWGINQVFAAPIPRILPAKFLYYKRWDPDEIGNLFLTWPSTYELLPAVGPEQLALDPKRAEIWDPGKYPPGWKPKQQHIDYCLNTFQPLMRSAETLPPPNVLVNVFSAAFATHDELAGWKPKVFTLPGGLNSALDYSQPEFGHPGLGDGTVPMDSATLAGYPQEAIIATHAGLPDAAIVGDRLLKYMLDPYDQTPPVQVETQPGDPIPDAVPPWPIAEAAQVVPAALGSCATHQCRC